MEKRGALAVAGTVHAKQWLFEALKPGCGQCSLVSAYRTWCDLKLDDGTRSQLFGLGLAKDREETISFLDQPQC